MKKSFFFLACFILATFTLASAYSTKQGAQSADVLFGNALHQEEAEGDYEAAIETYKKLLAEYPDNRSLAARAQFRIGVCYEKLGFEGALEAFQKVVENYPDQADAVKLAREKLSALTNIQAMALRGQKEIGIRKVWSDPGLDLTCGISPDGKYFSFTDWTTGDLAVRELATGKNRRLTDKGSWAESNAFAIFSQWSPDGRSIAYSWWEPDTGNFGGHFEMRIIGKEGGQPRILIENTEDVFPLDWQPDGKRILYYFGNSDIGGYQLGFMSVDDGASQIIKTIKYPQDYLPMHYAYSPDGRFIACERLSDRSPKNRDIFLLSADGKEEYCLMEHPAEDWVCDWTSDGKNLLFTSDRTGDVDLWIVRVEDGKSIGTPTLLKANMGALDPFGCTEQDQFFYIHSNRATDIYMAELDPASGQFLASPEKKVRLFEGHNTLPEYSPDGKNIVYISRRGFSIQTKLVLCIYSLEKNESREIDTGLKAIRGNSPEWRPDGKAVSLIGLDNEDQNGLYLYDLESHKLSLLVPFTPEEMIYAHKWASDGRTLFLSRGSKIRSAIYAHDLKSGKEEALTPMEGITRFFDLSPDGRQLVFTNSVLNQSNRNLGLVPTSGGASRIIYSFEVKENRPVLPAWSADGKSIFFSYKADIPENEFYMVKFSLESEQAQRIESNKESFYAVSPHPDGRHIVFSTLRDDPSEIWVIENFLPKK